MFECCSSDVHSFQVRRLGYCVLFKNVPMVCYVLFKDVHKVCYVLFIEARKVCMHAREYP